MDCVISCTYWRAYVCCMCFRYIHIYQSICVLYVLQIHAHMHWQDHWWLPTWRQPARDRRCVAIILWRDVCEWPTCGVNIFRALSRSPAFLISLNLKLIISIHLIFIDRTYWSCLIKTSSMDNASSIIVLSHGPVVPLLGMNETSTTLARSKLFLYKFWYLNFQLNIRFIMWRVHSINSLDYRRMTKRLLVTVPPKTKRGDLSGTNSFLCHYMF